MDYYIYIVISFVLMLLVFKVIFAEFEGRQARKLSQVRYFMTYEGRYVFKKQPSIIFITIICYTFASIQKMFSTVWFLELLGFVAAGVIGNALSQVLYHYYVHFRFKKDIEQSRELKIEIEKAIQNTDQQIMQQTLPNYDCHEISQTYFNDERHVAIMSGDGGEFTSKYTSLPPITYAVELNETAAQEKLSQAKVTTLTPEGKLPFKDEKIDILVDELINYDKFDVYRVLKPGGYVILDQVGSENYKEIINMFIPFRLKGEWNKESCQTSLRDIGFDVVDGREDIGQIRFESLSALLSFIKSISPERIEKYEQFMNFYADALKKIKTNGFFELTTHRFLVVAKKKEA